MGACRVVGLLFVRRLVGMGMFIVDAVCSLGSSRDASTKLYLVTAWW